MVKSHCVLMMTDLPFSMFSLTKDVDQRPRFYELIEHPYIREVEKSLVDVAGWYADIIRQENKQKETQGH